jgi:hypothetical protein
VIILDDDCSTVIISARAEYTPPLPLLGQREGFRFFQRIFATVATP